MSESESEKKRNHRSTSQVMGKLSDFLEQQDQQPIPVEPVPAIEHPSLADQLWNLVPAKLRNVFLVVCIFGGGSLGGGSLMGIVQSNAPVAEKDAKEMEILHEIKESQKTMNQLQIKHSEELKTQSVAQVEFTIEQKLHSQAIMGMKEDVAEIKSDVKENRTDIKNLK